jgi:hypothetical protein
MVYPNALPDPNFDLDAKSLEQTHFLQLNILKLAAFSWRGYLLKDKGAIIVHDLPTNEHNCTEHYEIEISYLSSENISEIYPHEVELLKFVEKNDPTSGIVITFADRYNNLRDSYHLTLALPISECYVMWQEQLLHLNAEKAERKR